jgi:hypothetical protein
MVIAIIGQAYSNAQEIVAERFAKSGHGHINVASAVVMELRSILFGFCRRRQSSSKYSANRSREAQEVQIFLSTPMGVSVALHVNQNCSVESLKAKICEMDPNLKDAKQSLILVYGEQQLEDTCTLTDYDIQMNDTLELQFPPEERQKACIRQLAQVEQVRRGMSILKPLLQRQLQQGKAPFPFVSLLLL